MLVCFKCASSIITQDPDPEAQDCLDDPRHQLDELEDEIYRLQTQLAQLVQKRVPLKRKINNLYSPILQLPIELASEIFVACFPANSLSSWESATPLSLGKVCSAWREVAWSMPWLWNTVSLDIDRCSPTHVTLLSEWITRSGQLPLSIHLGLRGRDSEDIFNTARVLDVVAAYSHRWRDIDFNVPVLYSSARHSYIPTTFPLLSSISVQVPSYDEEGYQGIFLTAPCLQNVWLGGFAPGSLDLPLTQITNLRLGPTTVDDCLNILAGSTQLVHCIFDEIIRSDVVNPRPVLAPTLDTLEIYSSTRTPLSELLDAISLPAARKLVFKVTGNLFPHWSFMSLVSRSSLSLSLEELELSGLIITERQLWECLLSIPSLVHLKLFDIGEFTIRTFCMLDPDIMWPTTTSCLLPNLQTLAFSGDLDITPRHASKINNMLSARWKGGSSMAGFAQLTSVKIKTRYFDCSPGLFQQLVKEGMNLSIVTHAGRVLI